MKIIDDSDEVWMWIHEVYVISQMYENFIHLKQTTAIISLFPRIVNCINETIKLMTCYVQTVK